MNDNTQPNGGMNQTQTIPPIQTMPQQKPEQKSETGPVLAIIIIVLVIVLGGLYFWGERLNQTPTDQTDQSAAADASTSKLSTSDSVSAIGADLNATDYNSIDTSLNNLDKSAQ